MRGMVLAAGLGTRLSPLTDRLPKPAVPLVNRPLASYALERLAAAGIARAAINTHHLPDAIVRALEGHVPPSLEVRFVREPLLLGTGGGVRNAMAGDPDEVVVMNGDIFFWPDLEAAIAHHRRTGAIATVVLRADPRVRALGALGLDDGGRVRSLLGTPAIEGLRELMFTGVHVLSARGLAELPEQGCIIRQSYRQWIDRGEIVGGVIDDGAWRDLGTPAEYLRTNLDLVSGRLMWPGFVGEDVLIDPSAQVESTARVEESVVGPRARIEATIRRCVVWPDTVVTSDAEDSVITPDVVVRADPAC